MKKLIINRKKWYRGKGGKGSFLVLSDGPQGGKMCCLGFLGLACGISARSMTDVSTPSDVLSDKIRKKWPEGLIGTNVGACLIATNDEGGMTARKRESELKRLFKEIDYRVEFKG